ncbi:hypothetical protein CCH79_00020810, partial [Gambusia affinis]
MDKEVYQNEDHSWVAPLPFYSPRQLLTSNREHAMKRLDSLRKTLEKKPEMKEHFKEFIQKMLEKDQAELAPPLEEGKEHWYLPTFGVYHPKKPGQIRVVFDSSAAYEGVSLNDVLLKGPDLNNTLIGVLLRFRRELVAVTADIRQMFYCFLVREDHRDYLRFLWYEDNNLDKNIAEYRMKVHVFGNTPSPAVAIYCMRRAAEKGENEHGSDARQFVERQFYVDDGLISVTTPDEAVDLLKRTRQMLAESNIRLHKVASNSNQVMEALPKEDRASDLKELELGADPLPLQRSLGLSWNLETDSFTFQVSSETKPFTKRGILSTVKSLFDPLGFVAPIIMQGKALLRELSSHQDEWDSPLPSEKEAEWNAWKNSLKALEELHIRRSYFPISPTLLQRKELCIFSDASTLTIGAVAYMRAVDVDGTYHPPETNNFNLVEPEMDVEIRPIVTVLTTHTSSGQLGSHRFERFSDWTRLCNTIARLMSVAVSFKKNHEDAKRETGKRFAKIPSTVELKKAEILIIRDTQQEAFKEEFKCLEKGVTLPKQSPLQKLNPVKDSNDLLRVGGRISSAEMSNEEKHPLIIPRTCHIATLLVRFFHKEVAHQGRHITEGALRAAGYWIIGAKRLVSSVIHKCVICALFL